MNRLSAGFTVASPESFSLILASLIASFKLVNVNLGVPDFLFAPPCAREVKARAFAC